MKERKDPNTGEIELQPGEHVPVGPIVIARNANGRLSGHKYDVHSGVYMGPASDEEKRKYGTTTVFNVRHQKVRIEP